jgi:hypothetical protein
MAIGNQEIQKGTLLPRKAKKPEKTLGPTGVQTTPERKKREECTRHTAGVVYTAGHITHDS